MPNLSTLLSAPPLVRRPQATASTPIATTTPAKPRKPLTVCSGFIEPIILTAMATMSIAAAIPIISAIRDLTSTPPLPILTADLLILLIANAKPPSIKANTKTTATAFHNSVVSKNVSTTIAPTSINKVTPSFCMPSAFKSKAAAFKTFEKLLMTLFIDLVDLSIKSEVLSNMSPSPSSGDANLSSTLAILNTAPTDPMLSAEVIIAPKSRPKTQSSIGWNTSLIALRESGIPSRSPATKPPIMKPPIAINTVEGE